MDSSDDIPGEPTLPSGEVADHPAGLLLDSSDGIADLYSRDGDPRLFASDAAPNSDLDPAFRPTGSDHPTSDIVMSDSSMPSSSREPPRDIVGEWRDGWAGGWGPTEKRLRLRELMMGRVADEAVPEPLLRLVREKVRGPLRSEVTVGPLLAQHCLDNYKTVKEGWCELIVGAPTKPLGSVQLSMSACNKLALSSEVALWASGGVKETPLDPEEVRPKGVISQTDEARLPGLGLKSNEEASHRCQISRCVNWRGKHVVAESHELNNERKGCSVWVSCSVACGLCRGEKVIMSCAHKPRCIKFHAGYDNAEELETHGICRDDGEKVRNEFLARFRAGVEKGVPNYDASHDPRAPFQY